MFTEGEFGIHDILFLQKEKLVEVKKKCPGFGQCRFTEGEFGIHKISFLQKEKLVKVKKRCPGFGQCILLITNYEFASNN